MVVSQWSGLHSCIASQMLGQDIELGQVSVLPAICLGAGLLDERDKPSVGEHVQSLSTGK